MAGGTDLLVQLKEGRRSVGVVVDVKGIPELTRLEADAQGVHIGAAVPCFDIAQSPLVAEAYPALAYACGLVGSVQIQNRASVGGNICNAAPSADTAPPLIVYGAQAVIAGPGGRRQVPLEEFFTGPGSTVLGPGELLVELLLPPPPPRSAASYMRFTPREEMDIAVVGVASLVALEPNSPVVKTARIALGAVAPTPLRAREAESLLEGAPLDEGRIRQAARQAVQSARPISDVRASADYRRTLVEVLTRRTLAQCRSALGLG